MNQAALYRSKVTACLEYKSFASPNPAKAFLYTSSDHTLYTLLALASPDTGRPPILVEKLVAFLVEITQQQ
jgi:hypothetical protein